jgi:protein TonB
LQNDPATLLSSRDYPSEALRQAQQGSVYFRLIGNINGRVSECRIVKSSGYANIDQATCDALRRRARFKPESLSRERTGVDGRAVFVMGWTLMGPERRNPTY